MTSGTSVWRNVTTLSSGHRNPQGLFIADDGTIRYRIVAKDDAGNEFYSQLLDEDPTVVLMRRGNEVQLIERDGRWMVHYEPEES